ncbi:MAG: hypothetical protein ABJA90_11945 [Ginsengibacter sp.]
MKVNLKHIVCLSLLGFMFFSVTAQKNYGILTLKKEDIAKYYENNVATIVFKYKKPFLASYKLVGTPFDLNGKPVLESFKLKKVKRHDKQKLGNDYKGILFLSTDSMKIHGIDGTFDIYFFPLNESKIAEASYVSYLINNSPDNKEKYSAITATMQSHAASVPADLPLAPPFSSFTLNPSPPYKTGGGK